MEKKKVVDIIKKTISKKPEQVVEPERIVIEENLKALEKIGEKLEKEVENFEKKEEEKFSKEETASKKKKLSFSICILCAFLLIFLGTIVYLAVEFLPKAKIKIITKKTEWSYINSAIAAKNIIQPALTESGEAQIPAEIFSARKNFNFSFLATGKKQVEKKSSGKIIIYNAYSSTPQPLIAGTRFESPDGKIFRLTEKIIIPGAQVNEGKIVGSSIEATVMADQPGIQYNIGPISNFSIPGFQGTPKYKGFYAESKEPMKGGFIGEATFPTEEDIKSAKIKAEKDFKDYINSYLSLQLPAEFKFISDSRQFSILKEEVNINTDEKNNFTIFIDGELLAIGFKESDLIGLLEKSGKTNLGENFKMKNYQLECGVGRLDSKKEQISFAVNFKGVFEEFTDIESFKQKVLNKDEKELKSLILSFDNIQKTTVSFWPFWVKKAPNNLKRVIIEVE